MADGLPTVVSDVSRWYATTTLAIGERTGLLTPLLAGGGTAAELASSAGVDRRNAEVWGDAMVAAGYARLDGERYLPDEGVLGVLRGGFPFDLRAVVGLLAPLGGMLPRVERAIRDGAGISSTEIQSNLGALPEQVNGPMYQAFLLDDWIAANPTIEAALQSGIDAAEIGPGGGQALRILAIAFPGSRSSATTSIPTRSRGPLPRLQKPGSRTSASRSSTLRISRRRDSTSSARSTRSIISADPALSWIRSEVPSARAAPCSSPRRQSPAIR
jgi:hypothetical protein